MSAIVLSVRFILRFVFARCCAFACCCAFARCCVVRLRVVGRCVCCCALARVVRCWALFVCCCACCWVLCALGVVQLGAVCLLDAMSVLGV